MKALEVQDIPWNWGGRKCRFVSAYMLVKRCMDRSRWRAAAILCALSMTTTMAVPDSARGALMGAAASAIPLHSAYGCATASLPD
jgi:hypothetical protein